MLKKLALASVMLFGITVVAVASNNEYGNLFANIYFDLNSAVIGDGGEFRINNIAEEVKEPKCTNVVVVGYGCKLGSGWYNDMLAQKRADAVRDALVRKGFSVGRITTESRGNREQSRIWRTINQDRQYDRSADFNEYNRVAEVYVLPRVSWYDEFKCSRGRE